MKKGIFRIYIWDHDFGKNGACHCITSAKSLDDAKIEVIKLSLKYWGHEVLVSFLTDEENKAQKYYRDGLHLSYCFNKNDLYFSWTEKTLYDLGVA